MAWPLLALLGKGGAAAAGAGGASTGIMGGVLKGAKAAKSTGMVGQWAGMMGGGEGAQPASGKTNVPPAALAAAKPNDAPVPGASIPGAGPADKAAGTDIGDIAGKTGGVGLGGINFGGMFKPSQGILDNFFHPHKFLTGAMETSNAELKNNPFPVNGSGYKSGGFTTTSDKTTDFLTKAREAWLKSNMNSKK